MGLADMHGALARNLIDLNTAQGTVDEELRQFMHLRLDEGGHADQADDEQDSQLFHLPCVQLYGYCKQDIWHSIADCLANHLKQETLAHKLPTGTLVVLQPVLSVPEGPVPEPSHYFLGVMCQKPFQHVLVKAWPQPTCPGSFAICGPDSALPLCAMSHQVFRDMVQSCNGNLTKVEARVLSYRFDNGLWSAERLQVTSLEVSHGFELLTSAPRASVPKPPVVLPFGLKPVRKPRKKRDRRGRGHGRGKGRGKQGERAQSSASSSDSAEERGDADGSDTELALDGGVQSAESVALPCAEAALEARSIAELAGEFQDMLDQRASMAAAHRQGRGSYFVLEVGFATGSIAPTARSECYHCHDKIAKGSPRFAYFWNERRPSRYMHDFCALHFVQEDPQARKAQAVRAMKAIAETAHEPQVKSAAEHMLAQLQAAAASSSA